MVAIREEVSYRSISGQTHDAIVTNVHGDGRVDIDINLPGVREPFHRTRIEFIDPPSGARGIAFPKIACGE